MGIPIPGLCLNARLQAGLEARKGMTRGSDPCCHHSETEGLGWLHPDLRSIGLLACQFLGVSPPVTFGEVGTDEEHGPSAPPGALRWWLSHASCLLLMSPNALI